MALRTHSTIFSVYENSTQAITGFSFRDKTYATYVANRNCILLRLSGFAVGRG